MINNIIKTINCRLSSDLVDSSKYWQKSPSSYLLHRGIEEALKKYATGGTVLDAGAGRLAYKEILLRHFDHYLSLDFRKTHKELDVVADMEMMPFESHTFDLVFCSQVIEHVPHPWRAFEEIHRVLKPGGRAIVTLPMLGYIHNAPHDFFRFTRYGLETICLETGFSISEIRTLGGLFSFLGYIRSTILMPLFALPLLGELILKINHGWGRVDIFIDKITHNDNVLPLNYLMVLEKQR